jgi:hypothetical protein
MKFKVGQEVEIIRNLGDRNRNSKNKYYHGGTLSEVPLETRGVINYIGGPPHIHLCLNNGRKWNVHPDEITPFVLDGVTEKIKTLERHPLFELAEQTPICVIGNQVYTPNNKRKFSFLNFLKYFRQPKFNEAMDLGSLDELLSQRNQQEIDEIKEKYVSDVKENYAFLDLKTDSEAGIVKFIFDKVFPHLRGEEYDKKISNILGGELIKDNAKRGKKKSKRISLERGIEKQQIEKQAKEIYENACLLIENLQGESTDKTGNLISRVAGRDNFALINGKFYNLLQSKVIGNVDIKGREYFLVKSKSKNLEKLEQDYNFELSKEIRISALKEKLGKDSIVKMLKEETRGLDEFCFLKYQEKDFGFLSSDGRHYAYLEVPSFGIRNPYEYNMEDAYFLFKKSKIGIQIFDSIGHFTRDVYMISDAEHINYICLDDVKLPVDGKPGEVIAKRLKQVKAMILAGTTNDWYSGIYEPSTCRTLEKLNIPIFRK